MISEYLNRLVASNTNRERSKLLLVASFHIPPYSCHSTPADAVVCSSAEVRSMLRIFARVGSLGIFFSQIFTCLAPSHPPRLCSNFTFLGRPSLTTLPAGASPSPSQSLIYYYPILGFEDFITIWNELPHACKYVVCDCLPNHHLH